MSNFVKLKKKIKKKSKIHPFYTKCSQCDALATEQVQRNAEICCIPRYVWGARLCHRAQWAGLMWMLCASVCLAVLCPCCPRDFNSSAVLCCSAVRSTAQAVRPLATQASRKMSSSEKHAVGKLCIATVVFGWPHDRVTLSYTIVWWQAGSLGPWSQACKACNTSSCCYVYNHRPLAFGG